MVRGGRVCGSAERRPTNNSSAHELVGRDSVEPQECVQRSGQGATGKFKFPKIPGRFYTILRRQE
jgi:hypothetical protein